jgi:hypothetical protein
MGNVPSIVCLHVYLCHVLEGDYTFHIFPCKYSLVFPLHKDLYVRLHGEGRSVTMWAVEEEVEGYRSRGSDSGYQLPLTVLELADVVSCIRQHRHAVIC